MFAPSWDGAAHSLHCWAVGGMGWERGGERARDRSNERLSTGGPQLLYRRRGAQRGLLHSSWWQLPWWQARPNWQDRDANSPLPHFLQEDGERQAHSQFLQPHVCHQLLWSTNCAASWGRGESVTQAKRGRGFEEEKSWMGSKCPYT